MNTAAWSDGRDVEEEQASFEQARPLLVSLHFVRSTLRRRLVVCVLSPVLGLLAAIGFMAAFPPSHAATASLVLTADEQSESSMAMDTNVSLLRTQTLATRVTTQLGLSMTPEQFLSTVTVEQTGSELMSLTLKAPDDAEAVRRLDVLASQYLQFRGEQLTYQTQVLIDGLKDRTNKLTADSAALTIKIDKLSRRGGDPAKLTDAISERAAIQGRVDDLTQQVEDATLKNGSIVASSRVLDAPRPQPGRALRNTLLGIASGVIGGIALGWGGVLFFAITSSHLRRRADVAAALGVDVGTSVGRTSPVGRAWAWLPGMHALDQRNADQRELIASAITTEVLRLSRSTSLTVAGIDNGAQLKFVAADAARDLARRGYSVTVIDLTGHHSRGLQDLGASNGSEGSVSVLRPRGLPALTQRTDDLLAAGLWDDGDETPRPDLNEVMLVVTELEPSTGAAHLTAWTERAVVVLTAGRTSVEKARTVADQLRAAGLELPFAALLNTDRDDYSAGKAPAEPLSASIDHRDPSDEQAPRWSEAL